MLSKVHYIGNKKIIKPGQSTYGTLIAFLVILFVFALFFHGLGANTGDEKIMRLMDGVIVIYGIMIFIISLFIIYSAGYTVELEGENLTQVYRVFGKVVRQRTLSLKNGYRFKTKELRGGYHIYLIIDKKKIFITTSGFDYVNTDLVLLRAMLGKDELNPDDESDYDNRYRPEFTPKNVLKSIGLLIAFGIVFVVLIVLFAFLFTEFFSRILGL